LRGRTKPIFYKKVGEKKATLRTWVRKNKKGRQGGSLAKVRLDQLGSLKPLVFEFCGGKMREGNGPPPNGGKHREDRRAAALDDWSQRSPES